MLVVSTVLFFCRKVCGLHSVHNIAKWGDLWQINWAHLTTARRLILDLCILIHSLKHPLEKVLALRWQSCKISQNKWNEIFVITFSRSCGSAQYQFHALNSKPSYLPTWYRLACRASCRPDLACLPLGRDVNGFISANRRQLMHHDTTFCVSYGTSHIPYYNVPVLGTTRLQPGWHNLASEKSDMLGCNISTSQWLQCRY